jgi:hypothetical protein
MNTSSFRFSSAQSAAIALALTACTPDSPPPATNEAHPATEAPPFQLAQPTVVMEASPPPPFTYWAPDGATIRNHPDAPGVWHAFVDDRNVAVYFGDDCGASDYQRFIGETVEAVPAPPPVVEVRESCDGCPVNDDLRRNRMNIIFDEVSRKVVKIACY